MQEIEGIVVRFPDELRRLLAAAEGGLAGAVQLAWWDGFRTGFVLGALAVLLVFVVCLWRR